MSVWEDEMDDLVHGHDRFAGARPEGQTYFGATKFTPTPGKRSVCKMCGKREIAHKQGGYCRQEHVR